jgi:hypothetical protein
MLKKILFQGGRIPDPSEISKREENKDQVLYLLLIETSLRNYLSLFLLCTSVKIRTPNAPALRRLYLSDGKSAPFYWSTFL